MAGASGRRQIVIEVVRARGRDDRKGWSRQEVMPKRLFGAIVRVME